MIKLTVITSFKNIIFDNEKKPIVICDIDNTFIRPKFDYNYYYKKFRPEYTNISMYNEVIYYLYQKALDIGSVKNTDQEGFLYMLEQIRNLNGKLIFLTARGRRSHEQTIRDLANAGLENAESYEIHYTNNDISKGDYIKKHNLLDGYEHYSFIDDDPRFIDSVFINYPEMNLYLFKYK